MIKNPLKLSVLTAGLFLNMHSLALADEAADRLTNAFRSAANIARSNATGGKLSAAMDELADAVRKCQGLTVSTNYNRIAIFDPVQGNMEIPMAEMDSKVSRMGPYLMQFRCYGEKNCITIEDPEEGKGYGSHFFLTCQKFREDEDE